MKHADNFESVMLAINPAQAFPLTDAPVRPQPRFAELANFEKGITFTASIPTVRRTWWIVGLISIPVLWFIGVTWGISLGIDTGGWDGRRNVAPSFSWMPTILLGSVLVFVSIFILRKVFPRIKIEADKDEILIGGYRYSWDNAQGLRAGYTLGGVEKSQSQWKFTGLRMAYGHWGHDLPYMVKDYYSVAYVWWINQLLETINHGSETVNDVAAGIKQELY